MTDETYVDEDMTSAPLSYLGGLEKKVKSEDNSTAIMNNE
jgi:hypothetical protein